MNNKQRAWSRLDNAAKIFPPNSNRWDTKVFRFTCQLTHEIDSEILLLALEDTTEEFPSFRYVLRHGLFWYYLEEGTAPLTVKTEESWPCSPLYMDARSPLFEVTYFRKRIHVETYHALTDGAGASEFLRALVCHYLSRRYAEELGGQRMFSGYDGSMTEKMLDSFDQYYSGKGKAGRIAPRPAYSLKGSRFKRGQMQVIEGVIPAKQLLACAKQLGVTLTELLVALLIISIRDEMRQREKDKPVVVSVPINLRKYFKSQSVRNFFSVINIGYDLPATVQSLQEICNYVHAAMEKQLTEDYLQNRLDSLTDLEHKIYTRLVPLFIKNVALKVAYMRGEMEYTSTVSNLGRFAMPEPLHPYIDHFVVVNSTKDLQICVCSYEDKVCIGFTSRLISTDIERRFFRSITAMGLPVEITTNL